MRFSTALSTIAVLATSTCVQAWNRLDKDNAAVLVIDYQVGLAQLVRDYGTNDFRNNMLGHAALGPLFNIPSVLTTSSDQGPNGLIIKEVAAMHPNVTIVRRQGEVNAWDNPDFRAAVRATGKKQLILGGIVTEVCTAFLALSLIDEGYEVFANTEASGTFDPKLAADANRRMEKAGVTLMGTFGVVTDLMRDWRATPGLPEVLPYLDQYQYAYGLVARHHAGAIENGTLAPVESTLI
ncbi:putative isochorismatase family hydrolase [Aspergillus clavatus NRRL 1]|uniref:Isochorismatase family hydrolase, putative n=1 Tax=Aspergillus clavatus (strain ATCC 1007 / CBS 513.65 / DSM 816 / NCTC 3887 / NRRL 1 / QM 1276 / 107) TaxID=344612 RepID=A1CC96_ASPCL|nr:isochorismatase family hydrolase, putative [Aspergillus clavatus NRRL 1]EAW12153.1 isochorismatase family hydrolase, putative [Aspergillus clavatus NRRL 1]